MSSSRGGRPFWFLIRVALFLLVFGVLAEVWMRTVTPASQTPVYEQQPAAVFHFDPHVFSSGLVTIGRLCRCGGQWRVNNAGWNSVVDYQPAAVRGRPLVALFGDSYVEAMGTNASQHVDAYLPKMLPGTSAYAFGASAWYLEQYVAVSRYVRDRFQPDVLVVLLDVSDVSDSLKANCTPSPYWWQIDARGSSFAEVPPAAVYSASRKALLAKRSALLDYLRFNAKLTLPGMHAAGIPQPATGPGAAGEGDAAAAAAPDNGAWRALLPAARFMVRRLAEQHPGVPVIFAAQSDRYLPLADIARTPLFPDGRAVQVACEGIPQCSFIDLRYAFSRDWAAHRVPFEATDGVHWNAYANRLVAKTLAAFITSRHLLRTGE